MKRQWAGLLLPAVLALGLVSCVRHSGYHYYPDVPRFEPTYPGDVELLRREPRRSHFRLGEVWIRPHPGMSREYVENKLREKTADMGGDALVIVVDRFLRGGVVAYRHWRGGAMIHRERAIVGVAIRYR